MVDKFTAEESAAVQRALGRLEGQFQSQVSRQTNFEITVQRQMEMIAKELKGVKYTVDEMKDQINQERWFVRGGWRTFIFVLTGISATILFVIQIAEFFLNMRKH